MTGTTAIMTEISAPSAAQTPGRNPEILGASEPPADCTLCPRLVDFRHQNQQKFPSFFNGAVPSFGDDDAQILVIGLAPGLKGANQTGRPFTGDYAGDLLYECLLELGLAAGTYQKRPNDGLSLKNVMITNAVRCVPPQNKPTGAEITMCRRYLTPRIESLGRLKVVFILGRIAHDTTLRHFGYRIADYPFAHGAAHGLPNGLTLVDSYHCSRYNVNTGRLTKAMFMDALHVALKAL